METARLPLRRAWLGLALVLSVLLPAMGAEKPRIKADDYVINAELTPQTHRLTAQAKVRFTALEDTDFASFELHNALRVTKVTDANGKLLTAERVSQDNAVRITFPATIPKGTTTTITFDYDGALANADDSPVEGLKLAYVGSDYTYLLYPGRWFPVLNYGTDRFTATITITAPAPMMLVGSGAAPGGTKTEGGKVTATFSWQKPSFPGTILGGAFSQINSMNGNVHVFFSAPRSQFAAAYADTATKEMEYFSSLYGAPASPVLNIVELPDDTVPAWWGPEIAALASRNVSEKTNYRLLADMVAHQWWGVTVSPATKDDWWLMDGGSRDSELRYVQQAAGEQAFEDASKDIAVGALAYDTTPLSGLDRLDTFSPEFQALVTDKGAMIFHMLRWVIGDAAFNKAVSDTMAQYAGKTITVADFQAIAEKNYNDKLTSFFSQWVDGTGAPEFKMKYTVYRIKKGFRIVGQISQDLDLFRMPVELKVDTDGQTEIKRIEVVGTESPFSVETFGKPRRLTLDPNNWVLKNSPELRVRVAIRRGEELTAAGNLPEALAQFNKALDVNRNSSLAHYRIADVFYLQRNYQSAANEYREAISGDLDPRWTEVWSHVQLGKIFDITGQRERAVNEYRQAIQTSDNTQGAIDQARKYMDTPYQRDTKNPNGN